MSITPFFRQDIFDDPTSFDVWDPFTAGTLCPPTNRSRRNTRIDWRETPDAHVFKADLPGVRKEDVKVEVEDARVLHISGQRSREVEDDENHTWHRMERSIGSFFRRFRLPENAKAEEVRAGMDNGVLTVTVPKQEGKKTPDIKSVDVVV